MLSETIKLVKGGLKNLSERTVNTDKKINNTVASIIILAILCAKFLIMHTKNYLNRGEAFLNPLNDFKLNLKNLLPFFICKIKYFYLSITNVYMNGKK